MEKIVVLVLVGIIVGGMVVVSKAMGVEIPGVDALGATAGVCYDLLNGAGQVVETVCH